MVYDPNKTVYIAFYADGGTVSSVVRPEYNRDLLYHYLCLFETRECAQRFASEKLEDAVFLKEETLSQVAREFNSSLVWTGMLGVALVDEKHNVVHVDSDELIKQAVNDLLPPNKKYGTKMMNKKNINKAHEIDFNRYYYLLFDEEECLMTLKTTTEKGKEKTWVLVSTTNAAMKRKADEIGLKKKSIEKDTLSGILSCFVPGYEFSHWDGILYIDGDFEIKVTKSKINSLLKDRRQHINDLANETDIYLDEKYYVAISKDNGSTIMSKGEKENYILVL